jgi:hypothetical protein
MRVNHGSLDFFVPQKLLDCPDIVSVFEQVAGKTLAKSAATRRLADAGPPHNLVHRLLDDRLSHMVVMAKSIRF